MKTLGAFFFIFLVSGQLMADVSKGWAPLSSENIGELDFEVNTLNTRIDRGEIDLAIGAAKINEFIGYIETQTKRSDLPIQVKAEALRLNSTLKFKYFTKIDTKNLDMASASLDDISLAQKLCASCSKIQMYYAISIVGISLKNYFVVKLVEKQKGISISGEMDRLIKHLANPAVFNLDDVMAVVTARKLLQHVSPKSFKPVQPGTLAFGLEQRIVLVNKSNPQLVQWAECEIARTMGAKYPRDGFSCRSL